VNTPIIFLACSGPGAIAAIEQSITIGYFCAAMGGIITLALAYDFLRTRRLRFTLPVSAFMMLIHPAWTVSALHGDCGSLKRAFSCNFTTVFVGLMVYQYLVSRRR
jgi:hypothetical protein